MYKLFVGIVNDEVVYTLEVGKEKVELNEFGFDSLIKELNAKRSQGEAMKEILNDKEAENG